jgi:aryl-alcohol dehydrogenase-like predicted oxidoreductase
VTATVQPENLAMDDYRRTVPRFKEEHKDNNTNLVNEFATIAKDKGCTPSQLALAWVLAKGDDIIPIPGTKRRKYLEENAGAVDIFLNASEINLIESVVAKYPDIGERYGEGALKLVNR